MNRFFGMLLVIAATLAGLVVLSAGFYLAAGWLGWGFNALAGWITGSPGVSRAAVYYGASVANVLTLLLVVLMISSSLLTVAERKWSALIQNRIGANRIKVFGSALGGIPFLAADALKMLTKERIETTGRTRVLYELAPMLAFAPVFALFAIIPVGQGIELNQIPGLAGAAASGAVEQIALQVSRTDTGLLYLFAIASLQVYGTALAGWASNNKLALLGGVRASSQMISYEVSLGLSLVGTMIAFRTLRLEEMVVAQGNPVLGPVPALGLLLQPIGFLIFFASAFAETKRAPFDLPEGESEIVGYFVEYSGMKFGLLFLAEFAEIVVLAGVITAVFLGGWHPILFEGWLRQNLTPFWFAAVGAGAFIAKMIVMMWLQLTIRWLLPRFRFDQIQKLCWKLLLPAALVNVFVTGGALLLDPSGQLLAWIGVLTIVVIAVLTAAVGRAPAPAAGHGAAHAAAGH
ncbi:NADH dehydrogenase (quinone) [Anaeromyxobacter dehalogenans 2CP-1]|uniref:NADH-quinone oxidoreductase subunit H n=1 Tax=Anaeromyxobacter dehalogenans (strain ATCC BAA-258 / DSM 21875 / 2CP-1) TaxID=455488 RepID=B8JH26_ANAD2|nr:complex I subunit 1 family protein [Anaeromyxobacter dehalogenans]ACL64728.1 NADH dehydrogenase (quinone) [Anaeromyxobacter dehalogenans 2CP-1]